MNSFDVGLAFLEGLALIASPCILPVLPLVLSASIDGGRKRPFGIIAGFVTAFTLFVLLSRQIVEALHIDTNAIRTVSLALLFMLGLVLLFDKLSEAFSRMTQGAANFGSKFGTNNKGGFISGVVIGALIGLVWTPCAGPILAAVLVQAIRQQTSAQSFFVTLAFAFGAGIPMFVIALTGRKVMNRFGVLARHTVAMRKIFAVLILASVAYLGFGSYVPDLLHFTQSTEQPSDQLEKGIDKPYPAPELAGIQEWLNSKPLTLQELKGKVVLIDFWTYSCINCVRTLPFITAWDRKYRGKGLVIIGVHAPEFEFEKNVANIKTALTRYGIDYPVAVDNHLETWVAFNNRFWPAHYLINQQGQVVYTHFGEGDYDVTENNIRYLLGIKGKAESVETESPSVAGQTPETYLGSARAARFAGERLIKTGTLASYKASGVLPEHHWDLDGKWKVEDQKIVSGNSATLLLNFTAKKVFLVMGTASGKPQTVTLKLNGKSLDGNAGKDAQGNAVTINGHALYELVNQPSAQNGLLEIHAPQAGVEAYAFTFGN